MISYLLEKRLREDSTSLADRESIKINLFRISLVTANKLSTCFSWHLEDPELVEG